MPIENKIIETRTEKVYFKNGIMYCITKSVPKHNLEDAKENVRATIEISEGTDYRLLVDIRQSNFVSRDARSYYISDNNKGVKVCAFVIDNAVSRIIGNMFMGFNKPSFPVKLFSSTEKAEEWLRSFN
ncbi:STAS/SEC14 domain-containing protein [Paracrocinitomix mangrovi]|uniref:DUF7793 family protein n=1 Tax=Paracrocinitomix mangrovi TaxID=2862509 RepID=UPI001C8E3663|nr:STAS/SEC14 domain-containing protein [Paracrocinitomix mangrovi]UKN00387.1 STAS/SEC14 domain-containing protein [Paracrocinitomix mangrovi]